MAEIIVILSISSDDFLHVRFEVAEQKMWNYSSNMYDEKKKCLQGNKWCNNSHASNTHIDLYDIPLYRNNPHPLPSDADWILQIHTYILIIYISNNFYIFIFLQILLAIKSPDFPLSFENYLRAVILCSSLDIESKIRGLYRYALLSKDHLDKNCLFRQDFVSYKAHC